MTWTKTDPTTDPIYLSQLECIERLKNNTTPPPADEEGKKLLMKVHQPTINYIETSLKHSKL